MQNIDKIRLWKDRLAALGLKQVDMGRRFKRSPVQITRWLNPDKYGVAMSGASIDEVEAWLQWNESRQGKNNAQ